MGNGLATGRGIRLGRRTCPRRAGLERQKSVVAVAALHQLQWKGWAETREVVGDAGVPWYWLGLLRLILLEGFPLSSGGARTQAQPPVYKVWAASAPHSCPAIASEYAQGF